MRSSSPRPQDQVPTRTVGLVWAQSKDGFIGKDGAIPWDVPEDLAHFSSLTRGSTVVMGRATWESLPAPARPLPRRRNVVLSRDPSYRATGADVMTDLDAALLLPGDVWVVGGLGVYEAALPFADVLVVTEVSVRVAGDTRAPRVDPSSWRVSDASAWQVSRSGCRYRVVTHHRRS